jgi:hypothetical protein
MSFDPAEFQFQEEPGEVTRPLSLDASSSARLLRG